MINRLLLLTFLVTGTVAQGQDLTLNTPESFDGYTLFCPSSGYTTYLINNCGEVINTWISVYRPGQVVYMLPNGQMLHTCNVGSDFNSGGTGGRLELFNWDGTLDWEYDFWENESHCQHHDVEFMPNGNILILSWEYFDVETSAAAGFDNNLPIWSEMVVEIDPTQEGNPIVWEWHVWDHLVVDNAADHPELVWVECGNQGGPMSDHVDWLHANAVDYNEDLDQIAISCRGPNEIWILDHSTTSQEAESHSGGQYGAGGDLLYRWGNPESFDAGNESDQTLFGQHDIQWIPEGFEDGGKLMVFNNGSTRGWSSIDVWTPPTVAPGEYTLNPGEPSGPDVLDWTYVADTPSDFFSSNISGATRQPNGNTLICEGASGHLFEVDAAGEMVWEFDHPTGIFRTYRYAADFPGFDGFDLTPVGSIDITPEPCDLYTGLDALKGMPTTIYPNPSDAWVRVDGAQSEVEIRLYSNVGQVVLSSSSKRFYVGDLAVGVYSVAVVSGEGVEVLRLVVE